MITKKNLGVVFVAPLEGSIKINGTFASLCVENRDTFNDTISVSCFDIPSDFLQNFSVMSSDKINEFRTFLLYPLKRTVVFNIIG